MDSSQLVSQRQRASTILRESLWAGRLAGGLVFAFVAGSIAYFVGRVVELPTGLPGLVTFAAFWLPLIFLPVYLPGEMRSASLVQLVVWPPKGELGPMPLLGRFAALGAIAIAALPGVLPFAVSSNGLELLDSYTEVLARLVLPVALVVYVYRKFAKKNGYGQRRHLPRSR